jgi:hypothetical protein
MDSVMEKCNNLRNARNIIQAATDQFHVVGGVSFAYLPRRGWHVEAEPSFERVQIALSTKEYHYHHSRV